MIEKKWILVSMMAVGMLVCVGSAATINQTKYDQQIDLVTNITGAGSSYVNYTQGGATTPYGGVTKVAWQTIELNDSKTDMRLANQYIYDHTNVSGNNSPMTAGSLQWLDLETPYNSTAKPVNQTLKTTIGIYGNNHTIKYIGLQNMTAVETANTSYQLEYNQTATNTMVYYGKNLTASSGTETISFGSIQKINVENGSINTGIFGINQEATNIADVNPLLTEGTEVEFGNFTQMVVQELINDTMGTWA